MTGSMKGVPMKSEKSKPIYPTVRMDLNHLPEAKNMKIGDMAHIGMHAKLVGMNQSRFDNSAEFEVHGIEHKKMKSGGKEEDGETKPDSEGAGDE